MKEEKRQQILRRLKSLEQSVKQAADQRLTQQMIQSLSYQKAETLATYLSMEHEFSTRLLIKQAQKDGKRILVPKTYPQGRMIFVDYDERDLVKTRFGLWEPRSEEEVDKSEIDLIHVPGLIFNPAGYRIGYGGGYYDRYLAGYDGQTMSSMYGFQLQDFCPGTYDVAVKELWVDENTNV